MLKNKPCWWCRCVWRVCFYLKVCMNCLNLSALCESGTMMLMMVWDVATRSFNTFINGPKGRNRTRRLNSFFLSPWNVSSYSVPLSFSILAKPTERQREKKKTITSIQDHCYNIRFNFLFFFLITTQAQNQGSYSCCCDIQSTAFLWMSLNNKCTFYWQAQMCKSTGEKKHSMMMDI